MARGRLGPWMLAIALGVAVPTASAQRLLELVQASLQDSPFLKLRELEVERAHAERDVVGSRLRPQVSATASWGRNDYRDGLVDARQYVGRRLGVTARLGLYDMPARHRLTASGETALQREGELANTRASLIFEVVDVYLKGLSATDELTTLDAEQTSVQRQVARLRVMFSRQMAKVTDLAETEAYAESLVTRGVDARNQLEVAKARLAELTGREVTTLAPLGKQSFEPVSGSAADAAAAAMRRHPTLEALAHALESARRGMAAIEAEHLPQLSLVASHVYADQGFDNRQQPPYHATSIGVELRVPLYEGGRVVASTREAYARVQIAEQQLEAARREIERETRSSWANAQANHARIGSTRQEVAALEQTVRAQERGVELGAASVIDLLQAQRRLVKSRGDHSKARYDFVRDLVDLRGRSGDLTEADVALWDRWFDDRPH